MDKIKLILENKDFENIPFYLLKKDIKGQTALDIAEKAGNEIYNFLLKLLMYCLRESISRRNNKMLAYCIEVPDDVFISIVFGVDENKQNAIHLCADEYAIDDDIDALDMLLERFKQINGDYIKQFFSDEPLIDAVDINNNTALHLATKGGDCPFVAQLLLAADASLLIKNRKNNDPLDIARNKGHKTLAKVLYDEFANLTVSQMQQALGLEEAKSPKSRI